MPTSPRIHLWTPGLLDFKGGIQTYSGFLLRALEQIDRNLQIDVFSLHDRPGKRSEMFRSPFHCTGQIPARLRIPAFAANATVAALQQRPDLIISTHLNLTIAADWVKQAAGIPYWGVAHGFEAWNVQRPNLRRSIARADQILAVSRYTRDRLLREQSLRPEQVSLLPNTFEAERFHIAPKPAHLLHRHGLAADQPIILTVNRLAAGEAYHPYDRVLSALPQIRQTIPNAHYLIVGEGDDRPRLERLIAASDLQSCVTLTGFVSDAELPNYYSLCDVFAMPSKLEGFGIVFLEAMASGKPILGSLCDGSTDALAEGKLGALVDPDDTGAIAQTLIQILQKRYVHPLMDQPAALRQGVIEAFGMETFKQTLHQLLESRFYSQVSPLFSRNISATHS